VAGKVDLRVGILENLELDGAELDAVFLSQALHHTSNPEDVIQSAAGGLTSGGQLIILDLVRHEHEWTRAQWADQWLGFDPLEIREWLTKAGLKPVVLDSLPGATPDLSVLMVVGIKQ
jgi:ArsR family transcriptional regulator